MSIASQLSFSTATNLRGGNLGSIPYQQATSATAFITTGTAGTILTSNFPSAPSFNNTLTLAGTTAATSTNSGALQVFGGVGIGGTLYIGSLRADATTSATTWGIYYNPATKELTTATASSGGGTVASGTGTTTTFIIQNSTLSTSTNSGALQVWGGVGIGGGIYVGNNSTFTGQTFINNATVSNATNTGALQVVNGGIGVGGSIYAGGQLTLNGLGAAQFIIDTSGNITHSNGDITLTAGGGWGAGRGYIQLSNNYGVNIFGGNAGVTGNINLDGGASEVVVAKSTLSTSTNTGALQVRGGVGIGGGIYVGNNSTFTGQTFISNATSATSTTTGALQVVNGGVGIGGSLFLGGDLATNRTTFNLVAATATTVNLGLAATTISIGASASGTTTVRNNLTVTGNLTIQGTTTVVDSTVTNISDPIFLIGTTSSGGPQIANDSKDRGIAFAWFDSGAPNQAKTGFFGFKNSTKYLTYFTSATFAGEVVSAAGNTTKGAIDAHLAGGSAMALVYQSAADTTAFLTAGTSGYVLQTNGTGSAPSWSPIGGITAGTSTQVQTQLQTTNASYYPTFVSANNASNTAMALYTTSSFYVNPGTGVLTVNNATSATSTTTGALQVVNGGVGIGGSAYVSNRVGWVNTGNVSVVYQVYNSVANSLDTVFG